MTCISASAGRLLLFFYGIHTFSLPYQFGSIWFSCFVRCLSFRRHDLYMYPVGKCMQQQQYTLTRILHFIANVKRKLHTNIFIIKILASFVLDLFNGTMFTLLIIIEFLLLFNSIRIMLTTLTYTLEILTILLSCFCGIFHKIFKFVFSLYFYPKFNTRW